MLVFMTTLSSAIPSHNVFPDLSGATDEELTRKVKSGVAEIFIGLSLEGVSPYVPRISGNINPSHYEKESFGPRTVKGMGAVLLINGTKDLFFGAKEKYSRYWTTLSDVKKRISDLTIASSIYCVSAYMPSVLYAPYLELGGQGAAFILVSFTALRGLKYMTIGTRDAFVNADLIQLYSYAKEKSMEKFTNLWSLMGKQKAS